MLLDRRNFVAGAVGVMSIEMGAARSRADPDRDDALRALLDDLASSSATPPIAARLDRLSAFDPSGLSDQSRVDYDVILSGLRREATARRADGGESYRARLAVLLGADRDPDVLHAEALAQAEELQSQADLLLRGEGLASGSVGERLRTLARDPRLLYSDDDLGRDRAVSDMNHWLRRGRDRLPRAFLNVPTGLGALQVRRMSRADETSGRAGYRSLPTPDGSNPGGYWVDLRAIRNRPSWSLPSVVHHELLPGHLLQFAYAAPAGFHPLRLKYAAGYVEGWAIYAEQLADEEGAFTSDALARIGYIQWRLFRLARVIADTGLHVRGWDRGGAKAALVDLQGDPTVIAPFDADIERMLQRPAALAAEGAGAMELARLKRDAKRRLGEGFDLRFFHHAVLAQGPLPVDRLDVEVAKLAPQAGRASEPRSD